MNVGIIILIKSNYHTVTYNTAIPISSWFRIRIHGFRFGFAVSYSEVEYETGKFKSVLKETDYFEGQNTNHKGIQPNLVEKILI